MDNLAVIPARSGSKGVPNKNIKLLDKIPLMAYTIEVAKQSGVFSEIMVSTDSQEYAQIALKYGANVPFLRSKENASDTASSWDVVREILNNYESGGKRFETVCLLQPTSPLREVKDVIGAYNLYKKNTANAVISVCEVDHSPLWSNTLPDSMSLDDFISKEAFQPRQKLKTYYRINGAIYIVNADYVQKESNIYRGSYAYIMPKENSIDIDTELDFLIAESIMKYRHKKQK